MTDLMTSNGQFLSMTTVTLVYNCKLSGAFGLTAQSLVSIEAEIGAHKHIICLMFCRLCISI